MGSFWKRISLKRISSITFRKFLKQIKIQVKDYKFQGWAMPYMGQKKKPLENSENYRDEQCPINFGTRCNNQPIRAKPFNDRSFWMRTYTILETSFHVHSFWEHCKTYTSLSWICFLIRLGAKALRNWTCLNPYKVQTRLAQRTNRNTPEAWQTKSWTWMWPTSSLDLRGPTAYKLEPQKTRAAPSTPRPRN